MNHREIKELLKIRIVEESFLELFGQGKLNGTVHTCIGQELSAVAFAGQLNKSDFVFSNHRCHGHYISYTQDWKGLISELMGKKAGVCGGIGSSQHLHKYNFFSNGIQGGIMPVAGGYALGNKLMKNGAVGVVYIGDGTLGEGAVYETLNLISKWSIPLLVVCENNQYAQSTSIKDNLAGDIKARAEAFGIETREGSTWNDADEFMASAKDAIDYVRVNEKPLFFLVNTYRLKAHSKGDDDRDKNEIEEYQKKDFLEVFKTKDPETYNNYYTRIYESVWEHIKSNYDAPETLLEDYYDAPNASDNNVEWKEITFTDQRLVTIINESLNSILGSNEKSVVIGEDIKDPYGGAFKITKGLSTKYPERVLTTSISESAIAGFCNGLALNGFKPFGEIMFGDFTALTFDQMLNHASKFYYMYNKQITCPMVIRTPMGGKRGYGPTHSQTIEKHFLGMDTFEVLAINRLLDPTYVYEYASKRIHPTLIIENKVDYGKRHTAPTLKGYQYLYSNTEIPHVLVRPAVTVADLTFITYGGNIDTVLESMEDVFTELDHIPQILCLSKIDPLPLSLIIEICKDTSYIITVEEGSKRAGWGSEVIAALSEALPGKKMKRIASMECSIPSVKSLEEAVLISKERIVKELTSLS
ncbi:MAG: thiamine pyrophosphate-dependent enzyme [Bacteroidota bacterium]